MSKEKYRFQFNKNIIATLSDERLITPSGLCMVTEFIGKDRIIFCFALKQLRNEPKTAEHIMHTVLIKH